MYRPLSYSLRSLQKYIFIFFAKECIVKNLWKILFYASSPTLSPYTIDGINVLWSIQTRDKNQIVSKIYNPSDVINMRERGGMGKKTHKKEMDNASFL